MLQGIYAAAAGMEAQQTQLDAISGDIANGDTPGYQSEIIGFHDLLYTSDNDGTSAAIVGSGAAATTIGYSQLQGTIEQTGNPLDVAIEGDGYLEVRQPDGTIGLTRNGTLQVNSEGQLTTALGMPLQPPITIPKRTDMSKLGIGPDGTISAGATQLGKITLVTVPAPDQLLPSGKSVFTATAASGAIRTAPGATLQQGALEESNVDLNTEMTEMMTAQQSYDMASKAISFESQMGQIAATIR